MLDQTLDVRGVEEAVIGQSIAHVLLYALVGARIILGTAAAVPIHLAPALRVLVTEP